MNERKSIELKTYNASEWSAIIALLQPRPGEPLQAAIRRYFGLPPATRGGNRRKTKGGKGK